MSDEPDTLICAPWGGSKVQGTVKETCADCGLAIALAPTGQQFREAGLILVCMPCGMKRIAADPFPEVMPPTEEQLAELHRHFREDYDDA